MPYEDEITAAVERDDQAVQRRIAEVEAWGEGTVDEGALGEEPMDDEDRFLVDQGFNPIEGRSMRPGEPRPDDGSHWDPNETGGHYILSPVEDREPKP